MNILFAYITPPHPERGGIGRVTHTLTLELQRRGHRVFYLIYPCAITVRYEYAYPAPLEYLPSSNLLSSENIAYYHEYLKRNQIDIVINQSGNFSDSRLWIDTGDDRIKVVSVLHSNPWVAYRHLWSSDVFPLRNDTVIEKFKRIARILLYPRIKYRFGKSRREHFRWLLPRTDCVCLLSDRFYAELSEICPGYTYKYVAIHNPNSYSVGQLLSVAPVEKRNQLLFVGLFGSQKREERLIRVWRRMCADYPDWELVMVGNGTPSHVKYLQRLACGIPNIRFEGFRNPFPYYLQSKIFCLTSNYEGWPMVLTEAQQCGVVPVAFESFASVRDIITSGRNGLLVRPFSLVDYESALRSLMDHPDRLQQMSDCACEDVKRFDVDKIVDAWEALFRKLGVTT